MIYRMIALLLLSPVVCNAQELKQQVQQLMATKYQAVAERAENLAADRRFGEGYKLWLSAVPDAEKTVADYFLLGNVFFEALPEQALQMHQQAAKLQPNVPDIQLELGMALHKCGKFKEAAVAYEAYLQSAIAKSRGPSVFDALLADCLIHTGDYAKACDAWERVPFRSYRVNISKYVFKIHGETSPYQRHFDLLTTARKKDIDAAAELVLLDCEWDWDWWTVEVNRSFLKADIEELSKLFSDNNSQLLLMQIIAAYHEEQPPNIAQFGKSLKSNNLIIGDAPKLPAHGLLASHATQLILENNLATTVELLTAHKARFESELEKTAEDIDVELVNVYANLLEQSQKSDELARVDRIMWQKTEDPRFATSYLASLVRDGKDRTHKDVARIIDNFSDHRIVSGIALMLAQKEERSLTKPLAVAIAGEFQSLTPNPLSGTRTSDRLNVLFKALRKSLME